MVDFMLCLGGRRSKRNRSTDSRTTKMLVSDGNIFNQHTLKVKIVTLNGSAWEVEIDPEYTVEKLKSLALRHFYNLIDETNKASAQYKLIHPSQDRRLSNEFSLSKEGIEDEDELLLLKVRVVNQAISEVQDEDSQCKGPTETYIRQQTSKLVAKNVDRVAEDDVAVVDFQTELRKALVSLIEVAQKIQLLNDDKLPLFDRLQDDVKNDPNEAVDPRAVSQLTEMGFSTKQVTEALLTNRMSAMDALEHLLQSQCNVNPIDGDSVKISSEKDITQPISEASNVSSKCACSSNTKVTSKLKIMTIPELMEAFRAYKRREFRPNTIAFSNLKEMGFDEDKIADSLRVSGNNQGAAFEWLISRWPTTQDFTEGLDPEEPVYKAIMANTVIQLGLNNPKVLYAFLHMLENPNCANQWLNDPDTAPILSQVFKIYHSEKFSLRIRGME